jgi:hypothetical protein
VGQSPLELDVGRFHIRLAVEESEGRFMDIGDLASGVHGCPVFHSDPPRSGSPSARKGRRWHEATVRIEGVVPPVVAGQYRKLSAVDRAEFFYGDIERNCNERVQFNTGTSTVNRTTERCARRPTLVDVGQHGLPTQVVTRPSVQAEVRSVAASPERRVRLRDTVQPQCSQQDPVPDTLIECYRQALHNAEKDLGLGCSSHTAIAKK